jgi:hypothetical protein
MYVRFRAGMISPSPVVEQKQSLYCQCATQHGRVSASGMLQVPPQEADRVTYGGRVCVAWETHFFFNGTVRTVIVCVCFLIMVDHSLLTLW